MLFKITYITRCVQKIKGKDICLFVYLEIVAFTVVPIRHYKLVPELLQILENC